MTAPVTDPVIEIEIEDDAWATVPEVEARIVAAGGANATRAKVRDALAKTRNFPGVTGITTFDPETREPAKTLTKLQIQNGKYVLLK